MVSIGGLTGSAPAYYRGQRSSSRCVEGIDSAVGRGDAGGMASASEGPTR